MNVDDGSVAESVADGGVQQEGLDVAVEQCSPGQVCVEDVPRLVELVCDLAVEQRLEWQCVDDVEVVDESQVLEVMEWMEGVAHILVVELAPLVVVVELAVRVDLWVETVKAEMEGLVVDVHNIHELHGEWQ